MNELLVGMGQRIASARKAKNLTQEQLAELSGVSYQTISSAQLNKKSLRAENIIKISQVLGVSTGYLLTGKRTEKDYITLDGKLSAVFPENNHSVKRDTYPFNLLILQHSGGKPQIPEIQVHRCRIFAQKPFVFQVFSVTHLLSL